MGRQNILVTGCNFTLGRHVAETLAKRGHWVFATLPDCFGAHSREARHLEGMATMKGYPIDVLEMDVTDEDSVSRAVRSVVGRAERLDTVVHALGVGALGLAESFTVEQVRSVFEVNVFGVQRLNRAVLPHMREQRAGLLLHVSSILGRVAMPNLAIFDASMFAMEALAEAYRYELSAVGVDSVIVEPGAFASELERHSLLPDDGARISDYGDNADLGQRISSHEGIGGSLSPISPELQEVVDTIIQLIEMPPGSRPLRTVVDRESGPGVGALNDAAAEMSRQLFETMGQEELLYLRR